MVAHMKRLNALLLSLMVACGDDPSATTDTRDAAETLAPEVSPEVDATQDSGDTAETAETVDPEVADTDVPESEIPDTADTTDPEVGDTTPDTNEPGPPLVTERFGARLWGPIIQMSRTGRLLWLGTRGSPDPSDPSGGVIRAGLYRIDLDSGVVRHYEDELPREDYASLDPFLPVGTFGPAATAGVQRYGQRYLAVAHTGLLVIEGSSVTPFPVFYEGAPVVPIQIVIADGGSAATSTGWLTTNQGLLRLDPATFEVEGVVTGADLDIANDEGGDFGKLTLDPDTGAVYAAYFATDGSSHIVRVSAEGEVSRLTPGTNGLPTGRVGDLVFDAARAVVYAAIGAWSAAEGGVIAWDGSTATTVVREGALAQAHSGELGAFGAQVLALDETRGWLAVGGQVQSGFSGQRGGGLVVVDVASDGPAAPAIKGFRTKLSPLYHWHTQHLNWDADNGRLYVAISDLCSEVKLRNRGLFALRFDAEGEVHYERPLLSGVRAISFGADSDTPWLGLRDDNGGLACDGYPIQTGLGQPQSGGSLALSPLLVTSDDGMGGISLDPGVTAIDAGIGIALGTYRDGFFVGQAEGGRVTGFAANQALYGPSLFTEDVLHDVGDTVEALWIAGRATHSNGDPPQLADRGPRGAALITIREGAIDSVFHYVRVTDDASDPNQIEGLPSGDVRDLYREADGSVLAACAAETLDLPYDRWTPDPFVFEGLPRKGGVARLSGTQVTVIADSKIFPDPRALTRDADGRLLVADAERGVWRQNSETAGGWDGLVLANLPNNSIPQAIWAGAGDDLALATSRGLWVRIGQRVMILDDIGFAWDLAWHDGRLYVGTDIGLVIVRPDTAAATELPARPQGAPVPF